MANGVNERLYHIILVRGNKSILFEARLSSSVCARRCVCFCCSGHILSSPFSILILYVSSFSCLRPRLAPNRMLATHWHLDRIMFSDLAPTIVLYSRCEHVSYRRVFFFGRRMLLHGSSSDNSNGQVRCYVKSIIRTDLFVFFMWFIRLHLSCA